MLLPTLRRGLRSRAHADDRLGRLRKVLDGAKISYAQGNPEHALDRLPLAAAPSRVPRGAFHPFHAPLSLPPRAAVPDCAFMPDAALREFSSGDIRLLAEYEPEALVLSLPLALGLANEKGRPAVTNWMVVLTSVAGLPLEQHHRDLLWRAFGVPVFEQLQGWDGAVIARECEVHDGLHVDQHAAIVETHAGELIATQLTAVEHPILRARTGLTAELLKEHCECGAETPRIRNLALLRQKARYAAAG
jgi:hypothetical protein